MPTTTAPQPARVPSARAGSSTPAGRWLVGFELLAELGRGAQSTVYRVRRDDSAEHALKIEYALKILDWSAADSAEALTAFRREAALLAGVNHPGLPRVQEVGVADGRPYLVMDLVDGVPLADVLAGGAMTAAQVLTLGLDLIDPLTAVHRRGLVHRDLKPPNIMVLADGEARLIDFGLTARGRPASSAADPADSAGSADSADSAGSAGSAEAETPVAVGTLAYSAPEQSGMLKRPVDDRSDLYSLGVILFEALAGRLPFPTEDVGELLRMHAVTPAPDLAELVPGTPRGLADLVAKLLAKDPDDRYQNGEALAAALRDLAEELTPAMPAGEPLAQARDQLSGRATELATLHQRWSVAQGGRGGACVIRGAGGTGKSSLTREIAEQASATGWTVLRAKASADDPVPFAPLRAALEDYLQAIARLPVREQRPRQARIRSVCAGWSVGMLSRLSPSLAMILNGRADGVAGAGTDSGEGDSGDSGDRDSQNQFPAAIAGFLTGLARESEGLMLVLDDVQWLDPGTLRVLAHLSPDLAGVPLLLLATARDDSDSNAGVDAFRTALGDAIDADLTLGPLDEAGVADQIQSMMPGLAVDSRLISMLYVRSNGNPFVVQEYLRAIVDAGLLQPSWGSWVLDEEGLDALELPQDAVGLVLARVQGLGPEVRELLTVAAAMGSRFAAEAVAAVCRLELDIVLESLVEVAGRRLIEQRDGGEFAFLHDRIREALLAELDAPTTADLHHRIAEALEAMPQPESRRRPDRVYAIAYHYMRCGPGVDPARVFAACWEAGKLALANHAPAEAVVLLEHADGLGHKRPSGFLLLLGSAFQQAGRLAEARDRLEQALLVETALLRRAEIFTLLANVYRSNWDTDAAQATIDRGLAEVGARLPRDPITLWLSTLLMFAVALFRQRTRIGFGSATGLRREHAHTIAAMHEVGSYLAVISMRSDLVLVHNLRALYWTNLIGPGRRYALTQGSFALVCDMLGNRRAARRYFARADRDPASATPAVRSMTAHYRGAAQFLGGHDNSQQWVAATEANGRWLDVATFLDAVAVFNLNACLEGRTREAEYWLAQGQRRLGAMGGDVTSFISAAPLTSALLGRSGEAGAGVRRMNELTAANSARSMAVVRTAATLFVLGEQGELGAPFERAVAEFEALKLNPRAMMRMHRVIHYLIATARLSQLRAADPEHRPALLIEARRAVQLVEKAAKPDELRTRALLARADLLILENDPQRALAVLARVPLFRSPDAPTLSFELARVRARALTVLGHEEGRRQARLASSIAVEQGWPQRVSAITAEFGLAAGERAGSPANVTQAATATQNGTYPGTFTGGVERQRLQALQQVSAAASRVLDPGELARIALDETIRILAADRAFLFLTDDETGGLVAHLGRNAAGEDVPELTGYSTTLVERVRATGQSLVVTGTEEGAALGAESVVLHGLRSILVAPLQLEGRVLGVVYLDSQVAKGIFTAQDAGILTALTNHIATSLETARAAQLEISMQTARRQRDLADTLLTTLQFISDTLDPAEVVRRLLDAAGRVLEADGVWLVSLTGDDFTRISLDPATGEVLRAIVPDDAKLRTLVGHEQPMIGTPAAVPLALEAELASVAADRPAMSWMSVPMRIHDGRIGALVLASSRPEANLGGSIEVAAVLGAAATTAYDKAALFKQVQELAVVDELTGIANRRRFFEVATRDLAAAARHGRQLTVLMVDIDHFKRVNDSYGHGTGDDVIRVVADRLAGQVRQTDVLGRYGGEEFALLLQDAGPGSVLPERLRASVGDQKIQTRSGELSVTVSIGLAYLGDEDEDIVTLLDRADKELYRAKTLGRNQVCG